MGQRVTRLVSVLVAGGVLSATLLAGAGAAAAATPTLSAGSVSASCGGSVTAKKGDTIRATNVLGLSFSQVWSGSGPVRSVLGGVLCVVQVTLQPAAAAASTAAAPVKSAADGAVAGATGAVKGATGTGGSPPTSASNPGSASASATRPTAAPATPAGAAPAPAAPPAGSPAATAMAAAFAPLFATLPVSFMSSALTAPGTAATVASYGRGAAYDAGMLFGSAFPAMRAGTPLSAGFDAANAVTSTSQLQALPVDGLGGGLGIPLVLAVLVLSGMAAFAVRRTVLRRAVSAVHGAPDESGAGSDGTAAA